MKPIVKKVLIGTAALLGVLSLGGGGFVLMNTRAFDESMNKTWDVPSPKIERSTDPAVIARGKHLVEGVAGCASKDCHGADLAGGNTLVMGPLGSLTGPNITPVGNAAAYKDAELARLLRYGVKSSGKSAVFMPSQDINWMNDEELTAVISYVRSVPPVEKPNGPMKLGVLAKVLDRKGMIPIDIARKIGGGQVELAGKPEPTPAYGKHIAKSCMGCHGEGYSGGPIPGAPAEMPVPLNLTPHETGLKGWTQADFNKLLNTGDRKNGKKLHPFMPIENYGKMDDIEKTALFAYLQSLPPKPLGGR
jgi:mono/diheme cytochrome c family protein